MNLFNRKHGNRCFIFNIYRFVFPSNETFQFFISDRYKEKLISISLVEKILQDIKNDVYWKYVKEYFLIQFKQGRYFNSIEYKIVPLEEYTVLLIEKTMDQ